MIIRTALGMTASLAAMLSGSVVAAQSLAEIEAAAKAEGMLTTIALPHDWCGYGWRDRRQDDQVQHAGRGGFDPNS